MEEILLFTTQNCSKCRMVKEVLKQHPSCVVKTIDANQKRNLAYQYGVLTVPALVVKSEEKETVYTKMEEILSFIQNYA